MSSVPFRRHSCKLPHSILHDVVKEIPIKVSQRQDDEVSSDFVTATPKKHGTAENNHWATDGNIVAFRDIYQYDCEFSVRYPPDPKPTQGTE